MANAERGEVEIVLDGKPYTMRPSWEALVAIESQISPKTLIQLMTEYGDRAISAREAAIVVTEGIRAHAREADDKLLLGISAKRVGELIFEAGGVSSILGSLLSFIMNINGGSQKKKAEEGLTEQ